jgi:hypothetical protein
MPTTGTYDEALDRFHRTGPEFEGWLSNHGPMVVEILARAGRGEVVHGWTDRYRARLDDPPAERWPIDPASWSQALGEATRTGDWIALFARELQEGAWTQVLARWWPRLLPGIAAGATHGVIRVGHVVQALREAETAPRVAELAHGLGYWAARWQAMPLARPSGGQSAADLLGAIPRVPRQESGVRERLAQLTDTPGWAAHAALLAEPRSVAEVPGALDELVDAAVVGYSRWAHGNPTMLVHAATAPNAVAMALPSLPRSQWRDSFNAVWSASAALFAAYRPAAPRPVTPTSASAAGILGRAVDHGGEHVIKFTDTALRSYRRTADPAALTAAVTAVQLGA